MVIEAMKSEEQDAVWDLLGKAEKRPDVSPTFAQDVARKARQMGKPKVGLFARLFGSEVDELNLLRPAAALGVIAAVLDEFLCNFLYRHEISLLENSSNSKQKMFLLCS